MKRIISTILAMSMMFTMGVSAFASGSTDKTNSSEIVNTEVIYVSLEDGTVIPVEVEERIEVGVSGYASEDTPEYGSGKIYTFKIFNEDLQTVGTAGQLISIATATELGKIVAAGIKAKLGVSVSIVAELASLVANQLAISNAKYGNRGFNITARIEYRSVYYHAGGYWVDCWDLDYVKPSTF